MADGDVMRSEERLLERAAATFAWPATPDLRAAVLARLPAEGPSGAMAERTAWRPIAARAAVAVAVIVASAGIVIGVSRDARDAVADFLGLAVEGERIEILPTPGPGETETPLPTPPALEEIATPIAAPDAAGRLGFEPAYPAGQGDPDTVYLIEYFDVPVLVLDYARFDLWESNLGVFEKFLKEVEMVDELTVNGRPAYLVRGGPHVVRFIGPDGRVAAGSVRTVLAETLVWKGATTNYRLEIEGLSREEALAIAEALP